MSPAYMPRIVDAELAQLLDSVGGVLIEGPKASGKTATAMQKAKTVVRLDIDQPLRHAAEVAPEVVLRGDFPVLLDEWQVVPELWNQVRHAIDDLAPRKGLYILTGSSVPKDDAHRHSGAGRIVVMPLRTMSLFESEISNGAVSLAGLFRGDFQPHMGGDVTVPDIIDRIIIGGWPALQHGAVPAAEIAMRGYVDQIVQVDVPAVEGRRRDPQRLMRLLSSLARNVGTEASLNKLIEDVSGSDSSMSWDTAAQYMGSLERIWIVDDLPAWNTHIRSKARLRSAAKRFFVDPSLPVAILGVGKEQLLRDLNYTGFLFESMVIRDLRVYAQPLSATVSHYRDSNGNEVDAIVQLRDGRWIACEIKLGASGIDAGAASLLKFQSLVDTTKIGEPAALMVVTATGPAYRRPDGVYVVPISLLGP